MSTQAPDKLKFFTSQEVADILKMNPQVIARKLQAGDISGYKLGKDWRVSEAQLFEFLERHSNQQENSESAKVIRTFFKGGKLQSIPSSQGKRLPILKHLVAKLDYNRVYEEAELNEFLATFHSDVCTLRREFIMNKLMVRKNGKYKVVAAAPSRT